jgi:cysteine-rich repeat protein
MRGTVFVRLRNMLRTSLALLLSSLTVGCMVGDPGTEGGDDDGAGGATCGDGVKQGNEACDDGNTTGGDGCSATCAVETNPSLSASIDKTSITTELGKTERVTLTLTSVDGFAGTVQVATSVVVGATPVTGLPVQGPATIAIAAGATVPTQYTLVIPSNLTGADLAATINFDLTAPVAVQDLSSSLNVAAIYTVTIAPGTGAAGANHVTGKVTLKRGTNIRFVNKDTVQHITHGGPVFPHETISANTGLPNGTYEVETIGLAPSTNGKLGCHNHQDDNSYVNFVLE